MDRAGLDATLLRDFCTLGATVLVRHWAVGPPLDRATWAGSFA